MLNYKYARLYSKIEYQLCNKEYSELSILKISFILIIKKCQQKTL